METRKNSVETSSESEIQNKKLDSDLADDRPSANKIRKIIPVKKEKKAKKVKVKKEKVPSVKFSSETGLPMPDFSVKVTKKGQQQEEKEEKNDQKVSIKKRTRKKKKKSGDGAWRKHSERKGSNNPRGLDNIRGVKKSQKSAVLYSKSLIENKSPATQRKVTKALESKLAKLGDTHRPIVGTSSPDPLTGFPRSADTPGGTELKLKRSRSGYAVYSLFESPVRPASITVLSDEEKKKLETSASFQAIVPNEDKARSIQVTITKKLLTQTKRKIDRNNGRRICSQNSLMIKEGFEEKDGSATQYGQEIIEGMKFEWLHFIAHRVLGDKSQFEKNLGCGSFDANTEMTFIEMQHPTLSKAYPDGYNLKVDAEFVEGTHLLTKIDYTIEAGGFELNFTYDCQVNHAPEMLDRDYVKILVETSIAMDKKLLTVSDSPVKSTVFYAKKQEEIKYNLITSEIEDKLDEIEDKLDKKRKIM